MLQWRKHIRLRNFDYSSERLYSITICTHNQNCFFGDIKDDKMYYSEIGNKALELWQAIPMHYKHVILDEYQIMPNHIHGILELNYGIIGIDTDLKEIEFKQANQFA